MTFRILLTMRVPIKKSLSYLMVIFSQIFYLALYGLYTHIHIIYIYRKLHVHIEVCDSTCIYISNEYILYAYVFYKYMYTYISLS